MEPTRYDTDLTDEQYELLAPFLPKAKRMGRPPADLREVLNGILYLVRSGCQWRLLPRDFPPWSTVHTWYRRWRTDGTWEAIHETLRQRVRERAGRGRARAPRPPTASRSRPRPRAGSRGSTTARRSRAVSGTPGW